MEKLGLGEGDKLLLTVKEDEIVLRPLPRLFRRRPYWAHTTPDEVEKEAEEQTKIAEED